jgi:hypothetical protein
MKDLARYEVNYFLKQPSIHYYGYTSLKTQIPKQANVFFSSLLAIEEGSLQNHFIFEFYLFI